MSTENRRTAILSLIKRHTKTHSASRKAARDALVKEGIYTSDGKLEAEYGGETKK